MQQPLPKVIIVWFKELERWDVKYFRAGSWHWPKETIKPLSYFTEPEFEQISTDEAKKQGLPIISKINFSGKLYLRPKEDYEGYKGRLFIVHPNRIIFSKINARKGCIFYAAQNHRKFVVSSEYPILRINEELAMGEYVNLALRLGPAKDNLIGSASGMAKARTYLEDFQRIEIPLPPLQVQRAIFERWQNAQEEIKAAKNKIDQLKMDIDQHFLTYLGIKLPSENVHPKNFFVMWSQLSRWDIIFARHLERDFRSTKYQNVTIADLIKPLKDTTRRITPNSKPKENVNYIGLANIEAATGMLVDFAPVSGEKIESSCVAFDADHILYAKLRPYLRKVIVPSEYNLLNGAASSEFLAIKPKENILKDFLAHYLRSTAVEIQARQAIGARMPRISSETFLAFSITLPPIEIQRQIMQSVEEGRAEIIREREAAERKSREIEAEIEELILGTKQIEGM